MQVFQPVSTFFVSNFYVFSGKACLILKKPPRHAIYRASQTRSHFSRSMHVCYCSLSATICRKRCSFFAETEIAEILHFKK